MRKRSNLLCLAGMLVVMLGFVAAPSVGWAAYGDLLTTITSGGLNQPAKIAVDSANGDVYVTDAGNKKVKKYSKDGVYDATFSLTVSGTPVGIGVTASNIFVGDDTNDCVWIYNKSGALTTLSGTGTSNKLGGAAGAAIKMPNTVAIAPNTNIFVVDGDSDKAYIFFSNGSLSYTFGASGSATSSGTGINLYYPSGIAFGTSTPSTGAVTQYFYIGDQGNFRVQKLSYVYYTTPPYAVKTAPTFISPNIGTGRGDSFGKFFRISDLAWDKVFKRLIVVDSLQMVGQIFDVNGATTNLAFNYDSGGNTVLGYLDTPTGVAVNSDNGGIIYFASNQGDAIRAFDLKEGTPPTISALSPATDTTPTTSPYSIAYTVDDPDSVNNSVLMSFYYHPDGDPENKTLIGSTTVTLVSGTYSGTYDWSWTVAPKEIGNYRVLAVAVDDKTNMVESTSAGKLIIAGNYDSCSNYTNTMYALYGASAADYDGDGLSNCNELNGTNHTDAGNSYTSDMAKFDTDGDGLSDGQEDNAKALYGISCFLNPRSGDTDGGGLSDSVEITMGKNPCDGADDAGVPPQVIGCPINVGDNSWVFETTIELKNTSATDTVAGDVRFVRTDGTLAATCFGVSLAPGTARSIRVQDYTQEHNISADFVAPGARKVIGSISCHKKNYYNPDKYDEDYDITFDSTASTTQYVSAFNDYYSGGRSWLAIRNPSLTDPVDVTIYYYKTATAVNGTPATPPSATHHILANNSLIIEPTVDDGIAINLQYSAKIVGTGPIQGYMMMTHTAAVDANVTDYMFGVNFEDTPATTLYVDNTNDAFSGNLTWVYLRNCSASPITVTSYIYKSSDGTLVTPGASPGANPKVRINVPANGSAAFRPSKDLNLTDMTPINGCSVKIVASGPITGYSQFFHIIPNTGTPGDDDMCGGVPLSRAPGMAWNAPYWKDTGSVPGGYVTWMGVMNVSAAPINATYTYYDMAGHLVKTNTISNVPVNASAQNRPNALTYLGNPVTEGSVTVTTTGNTTAGYIQRFIRSPGTAATNQGGSSNSLMPTP